MNTAKICVFGLALFCLCGCTDSHYEMKQVPPQLSQAEMSRTDIVKVGYELADGLIKNLHAPLNEGETVIVASFADVDNLTQSSTVGRLLGDIVGSRLHSRDLPLSIYVLGKTLFLFKSRVGSSYSAEM